jgi:hypothetical protein
LKFRAQGPFTLFWVRGLFGHGYAAVGSCCLVWIISLGVGGWFRNYLWSGLLFLVLGWLNNWC